MRSLRICSAILGLTLSLSVYGRNHGGNDSYHGGNTGSYNQTTQHPAITSGSAQCKDHGQVLAVDNDRAIQLRSQQRSGFKTRLLISGTVQAVYSDHAGHRHFSVRIGPNQEDRIEVIYNLDFGSLPVPVVGQTASACGDYIVSTSENGGYPASPDGMIIHWVHRSHSGHEPGFTILNGQLYN